MFRVSAEDKGLEKAWAKRVRLFPRHDGSVVLVLGNGDQCLVPPQGARLLDEGHWIRFRVGPDYGFVKRVDAEGCSGTNAREEPEQQFVSGAGLR